MYYDIEIKNFCLFFNVFGSQFKLGIIAGINGKDFYLIFKVYLGFIVLGFSIEKYKKYSERKAKQKEKENDKLVKTTLENIKWLSDLGEIQLVNASIIEERVNRKIRGIWFEEH